MVGFSRPNAIIMPISSRYSSAAPAAATTSTARPMRIFFMLLLPPREPVDHRVAHDLRRVLLHEVAGAGHRHDRQIVLHPLPRTVERARQQGLVVETMEH